MGKWGGPGAKGCRVPRWLGGRRAQHGTGVTPQRAPTGTGHGVEQCEGGLGAAGTGCGCARLAAGTPVHRAVPPGPAGLREARGCFLAGPPGSALCPWPLGPAASRRCRARRVWDGSGGPGQKEDSAELWLQSKLCCSAELCSELRVCAWHSAGHPAQHSPGARSGGTAHTAPSTTLGGLFGDSAQGKTARGQPAVTVLRSWTPFLKW